MGGVYYPLYILYRGYIIQLTKNVFFESPVTAKEVRFLNEPLKTFAAAGCGI